MPDYCRSTTGHRPRRIWQDFMKRGVDLLMMDHQRRGAWLRFSGRLHGLPLTKSPVPPQHHRRQSHVPKVVGGGRHAAVCKVVAWLGCLAVCVMSTLPTRLLCISLKVPQMHLKQANTFRTTSFVFMYRFPWRTDGRTFAALPTATTARHPYHNEFADIRDFASFLTAMSTAFMAGD